MNFITKVSIENSLRKMRVVAEKSIFFYIFHFFNWNFSRKANKLSRYPQDDEKLIDILNFSFSPYNSSRKATKCLATLTMQKFMSVISAPQQANKIWKDHSHTMVNSAAFGLLVIHLDSPLLNLKMSGKLNQTSQSKQKYLFCRFML